MSGEPDYRASNDPAWQPYRDPETSEVVTLTPVQCAAIRHAVSVYWRVVSVEGVKQGKQVHPAFTVTQEVASALSLSSKSCLLGRLLYDGKAPLVDAPPVVMAAPDYSVEVPAVTAAVPEPTGQPDRPAQSPCQHSESGVCLACRAVRAEAQVLALEARLDAILALHHPGGGPYPNTVIVYCEDFVGCTGDDDRPCPVEAHEVPACNECRGVFEDEPGFLLHPCPTHLIALGTPACPPAPAPAAEPTGQQAVIASQPLMDVARDVQQTRCAGCPTCTVRAKRLAAAVLAVVADNARLTTRLAEVEAAHAKSLDAAFATGIACLKENRS